MNRSPIQQDYPVQLRTAIARYLPARGLALSGPRWCPRMLVITILLMVYSNASSLEQRFSEARAGVVNMYPSRKRPGGTYAGFIAMLLRRSDRLLAIVTASLRKNVQQLARDHWHVGGRLAFCVDGSKIDAKRTGSNKQNLKIGGKNKSGPQQLLVVILHLGTNLLWSFERAVATASERGLLIEQLALLPKACLLIADAGFTGYEVIRTILAGKRDLLVRAGANVRLLRELGCHVKDKGDWVCLWPSRFEDQEPLVLRQIVLTDARNRRMCLLTNLSDSELSIDQACELYRRRWGVELFYRGLKQVLGRRKMHSSSADNAQVELDWTLAGYWILGLMLWENRRCGTPATCGIAFALKLVRSYMAGRGDGRSTWERSWSRLTLDTYSRKSGKAAHDWAHKKKDQPCGMPKVRMATPAEVQRAKMVVIKRQAA